MLFGIVSIVFVGLAAYINYQVTKLLYPGAPMNFVEYNIIAAMLPFLLAVVLSFTVVAFSSQATKAVAEKETEPQKTETQPKQEADIEETLT
jgi:large-conductance mechanosensitive channel